MAKIFLGIALAVMLATAALGFLTQQNATKMANSLKKTTEDLGATKGKLNLTEGNLKKSQDELTAATAKMEEQVKEITTQKGQMDDLTKKIGDAAKDVEEKTAAIAILEMKIKDLMAGPGKGPKIDGEDPIVTALKGELEKMKTERDEAKQFAETLTAKKQEIEAQISPLKEYKRIHEGNIAKQGLTGRVLAVNGGFNFVVLSVGDKQGSVMGATLLVLRSGEPIAKARVTSVEASNSIADILPNSVRKGVTVQPGDTVVFEGSRAAAPAGQPAPGAQAGLPLR